MEVIHSEVTHSTTDVSDIEQTLSYLGIENNKELAIFSINHSVRRTLPYGIWTCIDGREVVFNREYQPILQCKDGVKSHADRNEFVKDIVSVKYLYGDHNTPVDILTKHTGQKTLTAKESKECKKSLLICLKVLKKYTPEEHGSVNRQYSVLS